MQVIFLVKKMVDGISSFQIQEDFRNVNEDDIHDSFVGFFS